MLTPEQWEVLTPDERDVITKLVAEEEKVSAGELRRPLTFREFIDRVTRNRFKWHRYAETMCKVLQEVAEGERTRVIIVAPPRHGKSEPTSRLFPAYYLYRYPRKWVGLASYGTSFATTLARAARQNYLYSETRLEGEAKSVQLWETGKGGGMWAAGAGGSLIGRGAHLLMVDDPIKNAADARSETLRENLREWYASTFYTRLEPGGAIVIIQQRWNEDDLVGYLLRQEKENADEPQYLERWHIVHFEAVKEDPAEIAAYEAQLGEPMYPATCTIEPDWRAVGEALSPARYPYDRLMRIKRTVGNYYWNALYQQRPRAREGLMFPPESLPDTMNFDLTGIRLVRWFDTGAVEGGGDWTVGVLIGRNFHGQYCIFDVWRGQFETYERNRKMRGVVQSDYDMWGDKLEVWREQEPGSAGLDVARDFIRLMEGFNAHSMPQSGDKTLRAEPFSAAAQAGNVFLKKAAWNGLFRRNAADFPSGKHDDDIDAASSAFNKLARSKAARSPGQQAARSFSHSSFG